MSALATVRIGFNERPIQEAHPNWVQQQVRDRHSEGTPLCVRVTVDTSDAKLVLQSGACASTLGGGGGRPLNAREQEILQQWRKHRLDEREVEGGWVVAFLNQLRRLL